jgi:DNA modification methylase
LINRKKKADNLASHSLRLIHRKGKYSKCLLQIPARFAVGMIERGWILRNEIIWHKPNFLPQSARPLYDGNLLTILSCIAAPGSKCIVFSRLINYSLC